MNKILYFDSQIYIPDRELSQSEAEQRGTYVRGFSDSQGNIVRAELVGEHGIDKVVYQGIDPAGDEAVAAIHRDSYGNIPFDTVSVERNGEENRRYYDGLGNLLWTRVMTLNGQGDPVLEVSLDRDGMLSSRREHGYDAQGNPAWVREYDRIGRRVDEFEPSD